MTQVAGVPTLDADFYADDALLEPYGLYRELREAGPVAWLAAHEAFAVGRYEEVRAVLADHRHFVSAGGIALNEPANDAILGCTLASDPPLHDKLRAVAAARMLPRTMREVEATIQEKAEELVERLVAAGSFDAVGDLAHALPTSVVPDFIGWPEDGREHLLEWASANFDSFGPLNARTLAAFPNCGAMAAHARRLVEDRAVLPGGLVDGAIQAADRGEITHEQAMMIMLDYIAPSLDTTISAIGSAIWLFAGHPEQWDRVRHDPALVPSAFNEVLRCESPVRAFARLAVEGAEIAGVAIPAGSRVLVAYASANRDERKYPRPDEFDVTRNAVDQMAFGFGIHRCAGIHLARAEGHALLTSLARRVARFEIHEPVRALNNVIRAFASLPTTVVR